MDTWIRVATNSLQNLEYIVLSLSFPTFISKLDHVHKFPSLTIRSKTNVSKQRKHLDRSLSRSCDYSLSQFTPKGGAKQ